MNTQLALDLAPRAPLVVAYGMGVDSTAMLVGMHARGIRPDLILFADTGSEKPETYAYLPVINAWLRSVGFPEVEVVRYVPQRFKNGAYATLHDNCLVNETLPSITFGRKSCSLKWKRAPQDARVRRWEPAKAAWAAGLKVTKAIGYDNGPIDSKRAWKVTDDAEYHYIYPLRDWGWNREECERQIAAAGLPVPMKSACFMCASSKPAEIDWLVENHPELAAVIVDMEKRFAPHSRGVEGLWRREVKGTRGGIAKPGSMTAYIGQRLTLPVIQPEAADCSADCF